MSTPRAKYAKKRQKKKENLESAANNDEDRKETGAEHSGTPFLTLVIMLNI